LAPRLLKRGREVDVRFQWMQWRPAARFFMAWSLVAGLLVLGHWYVAVPLGILWLVADALDTGPG
jgi:hypothetical protein